MNVAKYMGKRLRENEIGKAYGLSSGKLNTWDLPEFASARQNMLAEQDYGMSGLINNLTRSGVEGPAAALSLERFGNNYSNRLLDLVNQLRTGYTDRGLTLGKQATDESFRKEQFDFQKASTWQGQHDQRRAQPNDFMKTIGGVNAVMDTISKGAELGFGGAAMLGKLPGMNGVSSLAGNAQGSILEQMINMLMTRLQGR